MVLIHLILENREIYPAVLTTWCKRVIHIAPKPIHIRIVLRSMSKPRYLKPKMTTAKRCSFLILQVQAGFASDQQTCIHGTLNLYKEGVVEPIFN